MTVIVGRIGCGKSNIVDAVRWVLGEQSVRALRGMRFEDMVFNGTEDRPPLGYAEVTLTLDNTWNVLPVDYDEVSVTRRTFRSGEGEYLINKTKCRGSGRKAGVWIPTSRSTTCCVSGTSYTRWRAKCAP